MNLNFRERQSAGFSNYSSCQLPSVAFLSPVLAQRHKRGHAWGPPAAGPPGFRNVGKKEQAPSSHTSRCAGKRETTHGVREGSGASQQGSETQLGSGSECQDGVGRKSDRAAPSCRLENGAAGPACVGLTVNLSEH